MIGSLRLVIFLCAITSMLILSIVFIEYLSIQPDSCIVLENGYIGPSIDLFFFSCTPFSDLIAQYSPWHHLIKNDHQIILFDIKRLFVALLIPYLLVLFLVFMIEGVKWVYRGYKK